jgi:hypothetical protein
VPGTAIRAESNAQTVEGIMRTLTLCFFLGGVLLSVAGCSSSSSPSSGNTSSSEIANPCATKGASYVESFVEQQGGTCGPISNVLVNVNSDGTITTSTPITCAHVSQNGCTAQDTNCTFSSNGFDFTETFDVTFADDGSSAHGVVTISGSGKGQSCTSTYDVTFTRQ